MSEPTSPKSKQQQNSPKQQQQQQQYEEDERMNRANDTRNQNGYHSRDHSYEEADSRNEMEDLIGKGDP